MYLNVYHRDRVVEVVSSCDKLAHELARYATTQAQLATSLRTDTDNLAHRLARAWIAQSTHRTLTNLHTDSHSRRSVLLPVIADAPRVDVGRCWTINRSEKSNIRQW